MKSIAILFFASALFLSVSGFAQGKPKAKAKPNATNSNSNSNKTTGTNSTPDSTPPAPDNNNSNNNTTSTPNKDANNGQKKTAKPVVGGGSSNSKLNNSSTVESPYLSSGLTPEEEARMVCSPISMGYSAFEALKAKVSALESDSIKIETIKVEVQGKKVTVSQVRNLLNLLKKDKKRLELAKYLVDYTCNKSQYSTLADMLFANHVQEFNDHIKSKNLSDEGTLVSDGN